MNWFDKREQRQVVEWPEGRDWRCPVDCGFSEPEDARPTETTCPCCDGGTLVRTRMRL